MALQPFKEERDQPWRFVPIRRMPVFLQADQLQSVRIRGGDEIRNVVDEDIHFDGLPAPLKSRLRSQILFEGM